jgi:uncharacterized membrane protein
MMVQHVVIIWLYLSKGDFSEYPQVISDIGRVGALLFLFLVGFSGYLSYTNRSKKNNFQLLRKHFLLRGATIIGWGVVVSLVSFLIIPTNPIWYGVLSFIGTAVITLPYFIKYPWVSRVMIFVALVIGAVTPLIRVSSYTWLPLGIQPAPFYSLDYWPYFPWIALVLAGVEVARKLHTSPHLRKLLFSEQMPAVLRRWQWLGSHTLLIYLLHVPIAAFIIWLLQRLVQ